MVASIKIPPMRTLTDIAKRECHSVAFAPDFSTGVDLRSKKTCDDISACRG